MFFRAAFLLLASSFPFVVCVRRLTAVGRRRSASPWCTILAVSGSVGDVLPRLRRKVLKSASPGILRNDVAFAWVDGGSRLTRGSIILSLVGRKSVLEGHPSSNI